MSAEENSYSFLLWPKMITVTSTEQRTESSWAFLKRPPLRLRKVTERLRSSLMALISILRRPMANSSCPALRSASACCRRRRRRRRSRLSRGACACACAWPVPRPRACLGCRARPFAVEGAVRWL